MRNTTDDPTWTSFIYHDHVSWFPGGAYVVEKLFREHFAETYLASTSAPSATSTHCTTSSISTASRTRSRSIPERTPATSPFVSRST